MGEGVDEKDVIFVGNGERGGLQGALVDVVLGEMTLHGGVVKGGGVGGGVYGFLEVEGNFLCFLGL